MDKQSYEPDPSPNDVSTTAVLEDSGPSPASDPAADPDPQPVPETPKTRGSRATAEVDQRIVVVGGGMVGYWFAKSLAERDPDAKLGITVIGDEPRPAYDRVNLTDLFTDKNHRDLELAQSSWYRDAGIELIVGQRVVSIDREQKHVTTDTDRTVPYDRLVLATGSRAYLPEVEGNGLPGVFVYRTVEDVAAIQERAASAKRAVVIGGGLLGLEAARAVHAMGVETVVCERSGGLMARQLDAASANILKNEVQDLGIEVLLMRRIHSIHARDPALVEAGEALALRLEFEENKAPLGADLVIFATGIRSRDELAADAGLEVSGSSHGIVVDDTLTTSDPDIHAIGECVRHRGLVYGLVAPGYTMAEVLADRITGKTKRVFEGGDMSCRLKLMGVTVGVFGDYEAECRSVSRHRPDSRRSLLIQGNRLVGATVLGEWDQISQLQEAVDSNAFISTRMIDRFVKTGDLWAPQKVALPVAQWPQHRLVCNCMKLTRGQLSEAIDAGALTCQALQDKTAAGTVCGSCMPLLQELTGGKDVGFIHGIRGSRTVLITSTLAVLLAIGIILVKPIPVPELFSVEGGWYQFEKWWFGKDVKIITGFTLLGVATLGMVLSLRKRVKWLKKLGSFGYYRAFHTAIGVLCLVGLIVHTGMRMGDNLNFVLMCVFLGLNLVGALAGVSAALEARGNGPWALRARRFRPALTWAHLILFWPLPVLVGFHIAVAYLY
ncbi:MAG: FAD-dependent oxidoreductase [Planctomycetota bacterium]